MLCSLGLQRPEAKLPDLKSANCNAVRYVMACLGLCLHSGLMRCAGLDRSEVHVTAFYGTCCVSMDATHTHARHSPSCTSNLCSLWATFFFNELTKGINILERLSLVCQLSKRSVGKSEEFFCDSPCYDLIGCGNAGLCATLNGSLPSLADWAAKTACFLFLSPSR